MDKSEINKRLLELKRELCNNDYQKRVLKNKNILDKHDNQLLGWYDGANDKLLNEIRFLEKLAK